MKTKQNKEFLFEEMFSYQDLSFHMEIFKKFIKKTGCEVKWVAKVAEKNAPLSDIVYCVKKQNYYLHGFIECKDDLYDINKTPNIVNELVGSIEEHYLKDVKLYKKFSVKKEKDIYKKIWEIVNNVKNNKIKAGIGLGLNSCVPSTHLLSYNFKNSKKWFLFKSNKLSEYTMKCFSQKKNEFIITKSIKGTKKWNTISMLINRKEICNKNYLFCEEDY